MVNDALIFAFAIGAFWMVGSFRLLILLERATDVIRILVFVRLDFAFFRLTIWARSAIVFFIVVG